MGRTRMGRTDGQTDGRTDARTDGRTDGQGDDYMLPRNFSGSITINIKENIILVFDLIHCVDSIINGARLIQSKNTLTFHKLLSLSL